MRARRQCTGLHVALGGDAEPLEWVPWPGGTARVVESTCARCGDGAMYEWAMVGGAYRVMRHDRAGRVSMYPSGLVARRAQARDAWGRILAGEAR
ncbi:hypothetical protein LO762_16385 [Actinocorallia sp. API 0066]|uniref:hypothetical protein n=1 Tax=Actinocorallia sp. API 0066 TaxID=2896846 RepID=UPI001E4933AD|nr:hypothetical protein [Actinocorallia sp. API 0066]MCD0450756.1 hypothetical protein [Actinocorallia sp. API 0066]